MDNYIKSRLKSFVYAFNGLKVFVTGANAQLLLMAAIVVMILGLVLGLSQMEWIAVIGAIGLVVMAELFNTAIEVLVDLISPQFDEKAGRTKDIAAAATLVCVITAACVGFIVFIPKIVGLL